MKINKMKKWCRFDLYGKKSISVIAIIWVAFSVLAVFSIIKPLEINRKTYENKVLQKTTYSYKADVVKSTLYPDGGIIDPKGGIVFPRVTKSMPMQIITRFDAQDPIHVDLSQKVVLSIAADELWERNLILQDKKDYTYYGAKNEIRSDVSIDLADILAYVEKVETELGVRQGRLLLKVRPLMEGNMIILNGLS